MLYPYFIVFFVVDLYSSGTGYTANTRVMVLIMEFTLDMSIIRLNQQVYRVFRVLDDRLSVRNHIVRLWMNFHRRFTHPLCDHEFDESCLLCSSVYALCEHDWWEACMYCRRV